MRKKAVITITLVGEGGEKSNRELKMEIFAELSKYPSRIPWKQALKVEVTED